MPWEEWRTAHHLDAKTVPQAFHRFRVYTKDDLDTYLDRVSHSLNWRSRNAYQYLTRMYDQVHDKAGSTSNALSTYLLDNFCPSDPRFTPLRQPLGSFSATMKPDITHLPGFHVDKLPDWTAYLYSHRNPFIHFTVPPTDGLSSSPDLVGKPFDILFAILTLGALMPAGIRLAALEFAHAELQDANFTFNRRAQIVLRIPLTLHATQHKTLTSDVVREYLSLTPFTQTEIEALQAWAANSTVR
ncbi:hypothetical protein EUX98_g8851 [Antrodiella citrinella]|uniref:Uncharacterized protein n=1 Tax=Antrodiella citrinella TaxID=2447956 RepID=A0A4S4M3B8_9APHY|nr:hypothetical protein EUX98_g8851 [Antrodiella citrinella]